MDKSKKSQLALSPQNSSAGYSAGYRWLVLMVATVVQITIAFIPMGMGPLAPFFVQDLRLNNTQVGFIGGAVNGGQTITSLLAGRAVDLWGEKIVLIVGSVFSGISILLASRANSFFALLPLLFFSGLWVASSTPAGSKAIMTWFPPEERGLALGVRQTGLPAAGMLASLILPVVASRYSWRVALLLMAVVSISGAIFCLVAYQEYPKGSSEKAKQLKPGRMTVVVRNRNIWLTGITAITYISAQFTVISYMILYFNHKMGLSITVASLLLALAQLAGIAGRILWGAWSDRYFGGARKPVLIVVGGVMAFLALIMAFLPTTTPIWILVLIAWCLGFSTIGWNGVFIALLSELGKEQSGTSVGLGITLMQVGVLIFPPMFGFLADRNGNYEFGWIALFVLLLIGITVMSLVHEPPKAQYP